MKLAKIPKRGKYCKDCPCMVFDLLEPDIDKRRICTLFRDKNGYVTILLPELGSLNVFRCDECLTFKPVITKGDK